MKKCIQFERIVPIFIIAVFLFVGCKEKPKAISKELALNTESLPNATVPTPTKTVSEAFKKYWYAGKAEITSYELQQARYGEIREGKAVLIYVTEPFLPEKQVKADRSNPDNVSVLKLNATKKYLTGIYPYSIMSSTFYPIQDDQHAIKTSLSVQEWCGHVYAQLNNRDEFEYTAHSYFENEADETVTMDKALLENEIWNKIRINPEGLPTGDVTIIPSLEFLRLGHGKIKALKANAQLETIGNGLNTYTIDYMGAERKLSITFTSEFPYTIESWTEEFKSGFGPNAKRLVSSGKKIKQLKTAYWGQNSNDDEVLRKELGLQ